MVQPKVVEEKSTPSVACKRRIRRKNARARVKSEKAPTDNTPDQVEATNVPKDCNDKMDAKKLAKVKKTEVVETVKTETVAKPEVDSPTMSKEPNKSREDVKAAREAKKLAKQKAKNKTGAKDAQTEEKAADIAVKQVKDKKSPVKEKDEVDRAVINKVKEIKPKMGAAQKGADSCTLKGILNKSVSETLDKIADAAKEVKELTAKIEAIKVTVDNNTKSDVTKEESTKSKAELKAERRAKQEAQRAAKAQATKTAQATKEKTAAKTKPTTTTDKGDKRSEKTKSKTPEKSTVKVRLHNDREIWFQHLHAEREQALRKVIGINNTNVHPAVVKLGVQLSSHTIRGSNARCIALLNALKEVIKDYTLPAKTEYSRGLEAYLANCIDYLWSMRKPSSSQTNAIKYFRYQLTQLPNNVNDYDAKSTLLEAIDTYIREQIDMAGQAISLSVRKKISAGDSILTYDCSSLVERILKDAWDAGVTFRAVVVGTVNGAGSRGREMLRRLTSHGIPVTYVDLTAVDFVMKHIDKVIIGASALLVNGWVMGVAGTALLCLSARAYNVPVLVCCERHKFSERVQTDAFVYNELGDPDELVDKSNENCPLREWRTNPNLTLLNIMYDVTPPSLISAVVTDLAILPCSSAPVVLRFMLSEYGF